MIFIWKCQVCIKARMKQHAWLHWFFVNICHLWHRFYYSSFYKYPFLLNLFFTQVVAVFFSIIITDQNGRNFTWFPCILSTRLRSNYFRCLIKLRLADFSYLNIIWLSFVKRIYLLFQLFFVMIEILQFYTKPEIHYRWC